MSHAARTARLQASLAENELQALLVTDLTNVLYLSGFAGSNGQLFVTSDRVVLLTDPRYAARAGTLVSDAEISIYETRLRDGLTPLLAEQKRVGIEATSMTVADKADLAGAFPDVELVDTRALTEELRRTKDEDEIAHIREAVRVADETFSWVLDRIEPGRAERDIALDLEVHMRSLGADAPSFEPIVGSGPLSAHIHHSPSDRALELGDLVLLDFGARWNGYCSDLTRTVVLGSATDEQRAQYDLVARAHAAGVAAVMPGAGGRDVDAQARAVIDEAGRGAEFGHGLGHGVGLDIHEAPRLHKTSEDTLKVNEVVTVEPGVYIVDSGGVRIEDCVLVTETGAEVLGKAPRDGLLEMN
ncbi:MAG TPA: Xaa-Pro peptidase family protein [Actinomycetota bacterium]|nr:Xaa-Pro peptidase family protein [Actinomycetota bacterium]